MAGDIRINVRTNAARVVAEFRALQDRDLATATYRALNRAQDRLATETAREVRKVYNVKATVVRGALKKRRATSKSLFARLTVEGARLPLIAFAARAVNPWNVKGRARRPGGGVSVQVKLGGARKLVRGAFIAASTRNNARGGGSEGMLQVWRRRDAARDSLRSLRSISVPQAVANQAVIAALQKLAGDEFEKNFAQQLVFLSRG